MDHCSSREMQLNPSQISSSSSSTLPDLQNGAGAGQIHNFDPSSSHDDFYDQVLSGIPSFCWDLKSDDFNDLNAGGGGSNASPFQFDESALLVSKLRQHQITGVSPADKIMMIQQQMQQILPLLGGQDDIVDRGVEGMYNGFGGSLHGSGQTPNQTQHFHQSQGGVGGHMQAQNFGAPVAVMSQPPATSSAAAPAQPRQRVRARRGQATDPHSIAERLRRERIAERMKALQELVPNGNKTDKASMLDEIIDYVKFLQLQVKVLSMSRLGGAGAVAPLVADRSSEANGGTMRSSNGTQTASSTENSVTVTEHQVAKLMEEDMGSAMQYLQGKGLCLMPISLATAISTATCHSRNPMSAATNHNQLLGGEGPSSPSMSVLTVQSATMGNGTVDGSVKDAASVSKP